MTVRAVRSSPLRRYRYAEPGQIPHTPGGHRRLGRALWLALVAITVVGFGLIASRSTAPPADSPPQQPDVAAAARTIDLLVRSGHGKDPLAELPADFSAVSGVKAVRAVGRDGTPRAHHAGGGCSAPWGDDNTRWGFGDSCKAHDLGYDLLRYANSKGHPLGPEVRRQLDERLSNDMHQRCETNPRGAQRACHMVASVYTAGLVVNSWHQRWGPPTGEPIGPWLAGILVIGLLLAVRLRGWVRVRRAGAGKPVPAARTPKALHPEATDPEATDTAPADRAPAPETATSRSPHQSCGDRYLAFLRVGSIAGIMFGEAVLAFMHWLGTNPGWLWPLTWVCQLAVVFFFAGGHANLHSWRAVRAGGGGYGQYLSGRVGWLMRPVLALILAWLVVPLSLELLGVGSATTSELASITAQPLWLLGCYLVAVAATPLMAWLHLRRPLLTPAALAAGVLLVWLAPELPVVHLASGLLVGLLGQQAGFHYADGNPQRLPKLALVGAATAGLAALLALCTLRDLPLTMLSSSQAPSSLGAPAAAVLLLGCGQLSMLVLLRRPLSRALAAPAAWRAITFTRSAPMSLYLGFLAGLLAAVALADLPVTVDGLSWLLEPRQLTALALLAVPALLAFWWGERRDGFRWAFGWSTPRVDSPSARIAAVLGVGYGLLGVFGFALGGFAEGFAADGPRALLGLPIDPLQNVIHLVLGWFLLHALRTGSTERMSTWLLTALACVPPLMTASALPGEHATAITVHAGTAVLAMTVTVALTVLKLRARFAVPASVR